ncbi:MAG: ABC transporter permease [Clostridiales Family XIII bacterium]|jgi:ABC-2 type transport system permease protein|nr:ABC transporter permease [Clostridiales Family XIII bacterium]
MKIRALTIRILRQLSHDKRTLALMFVLPLLLLTLIYFIFQGTSSTMTIGTVGVPETFTSILNKNENIKLKDYATWELAQQALERGDVVAIVQADGFTTDVVSGAEGFRRDVLESADAGVNFRILLDGAQGDKAASIRKLIEAAASSTVMLILQQAASEVAAGVLPDITYTPGSVDLNLGGLLTCQVEWLDGVEDVTNFDIWGSTLLGFVSFFLVFIVAGMTFLKERKSGTLEKVLSAPVQRREIVIGYVAGFGVITVIQSIVVSLFVIKVLGVVMNGSLLAILLIMVISTVPPLTLGMLLSTAANSEFQMMQFIPIVIVPQVFFSGLFSLSKGWMLFGKIFPLTYTTDALNKVMFKGAGPGAFYGDLLMLIAFSAVFMTLNVLLLKKHRRI